MATGFAAWFLCLIAYKPLWFIQCQNSFSHKNSGGTIKPIAEGIMRFMPFPRVLLQT